MTECDLIFVIFFRPFGILFNNRQTIRTTTNENFIKKYFALIKKNRSRISFYVLTFNCMYLGEKYSLITLKLIKTSNLESTKNAFYYIIHKINFFSEQSIHSSHY